MSILLTSGGFKNQAIIDTFKKLLVRPLQNTKVAFIITASLGETGDKRWLIDDYNALHNIGVSEVDIVDIGRDKTEWLPQLEWADVLWVEGGNTSFLMYQVQKYGFQEVLPYLLKDKIYVGVSAGSMVMGKRLPQKAERLIYNEVFKEPYNTVPDYIGQVLVHILPHFQADFLQRSDKDLQQLIGQTMYPVYALDDNSALVIKEGKVVEVISTGKWKVYNG